MVSKKLSAHFSSVCDEQAENVCFLMAIANDWRLAAASMKYALKSNAVGGIQLKQ